MEIFIMHWAAFFTGILSVMFLHNGSTAETPVPDPNGYIMYCPCMGRFGNQADQFLGSLAFAKSLDRTLVVPPWIEYRYDERRTDMVPYDTYFKLEALKDFHRVISMEEFMKTLGSTVWPKGQRKVFCYTARDGPSKEKSCNAKDGNPFGPFWDWFNVDFDQSEIFGPLYFNAESQSTMEEWRKKYPSSRFPVLAFTGPPAPFPLMRHHVRLHRHVQWSDNYDKMAKDFIKDRIANRPFLAIHLRNGLDFERACNHVSPNMFAVAQCVGERGQYGTITYEMCYPSHDTVVQQVKKELQRMGVKTLFIATDNDNLKSEFAVHIKNVDFVSQEERADPLLDLAVMGRADHFIGNCVSTFSAFVKRERDVKRLTSSFWAFEKRKREEL